MPTVSRKISNDLFRLLNERARRRGKDCPRRHRGVFLIYANILLGIQSNDPQLIEMGSIYRLKPAALFGRVILPGALPSIFTGLHYALAIMRLMLIVAETISARSGLRYMAMQA